MTNYVNMLDQLESRIAVAGLAGTEPEMRRVADALVRTGALPVVAGIIADPDAPEVARLRALARASRALRSADVPSPALMSVA